MKRSRNKHVVVLLRLFYFFCFLEKSLPKRSVLNGIVVKGIKCRLLFFGKEVTTLELTPSQKKTVTHQFDSYCKKILRGECRDYHRRLARQQKNEISFSELSEDQMQQLYVEDEYPSEQCLFQVYEHEIFVHDEKLALALQELPDEKRDIVLLAYFLEMTDQEIADKLNAVRRTVQYKRVRALEDMRTGLEVMADGNSNNKK